MMCLGTSVSGFSFMLLVCKVCCEFYQLLLKSNHSGLTCYLCLYCSQAVDVVGQAGKPKAITGFQTHTTPVLLAHGERAELATEEYLPVTPILEGFVILRKNPNYES